MLPEDARLAHDLLALRHRADALEDAATAHQAADFADVVLLVDERCFRFVYLNCLFSYRSNVYPAELPVAPSMPPGTNTQALYRDKANGDLLS